jgi:carotenoid 1,2-hydratase
MNIAQAPRHFRGSGAGFDRCVSNDGYAWWYVDAMSDDGRNGITVIAFIGSVFSPYYAWARRKTTADPLNHCALNVALYGKRHRWAMTERSKRNVDRSSSSLSIGPSNLSWDGTALTIAVDEITVPFPFRIRGTIRICPTAITDTRFTLNPNGDHTWWPIAPTARVEVALNQPAMRWQGDGYLDMNTGDAPLESGFVKWEWSRGSLRDRTAILYEAERRDGERSDLALTFLNDGTMQTFKPPSSVALKPAGWRMERSTRSDLDHSPHVIKTLEDAPFYARSIVSGKLLGEPVTLMHESLSLDKFRMPIVQALLPFRMPRASR